MKQFKPGFKKKKKKGPLLMLMANEYWRFLSGTDFLSFFISSHFIYYQGERLEIDEVIAEIWEVLRGLRRRVFFIPGVLPGCYVCRTDSLGRQSQGHTAWGASVPVVCILDLERKASECVKRRLFLLCSL